MNRVPVFYIDVDDTLVRHIGTKVVPIVSTINHLKSLKENGAVLYCWSSAGAKEAERICKLFEISEIFEAFLSKPNVLIDDCNIRDWHDLKQYHPNEIISADLSFYRKELKW